MVLDLSTMVLMISHTAVLRLWESFCGSTWQETAKYTGVQHLGRLPMTMGEVLTMLVCCGSGHRFIVDRKDLPTNTYGAWNTSMLDDEDLAQAIHLHLQLLGPWIWAQDVVDFVKCPKNLTQFGLTWKKPISLATGQQWMKHLGYRLTTNPSGQYVDRHERKDIIDYCQKKILPQWMSIEDWTRKWTDDQKEELIGEQPANRRWYVCWQLNMWSRQVA